MNQQEIDQLNTFLKKIQARSENYIGYPSGRECLELAGYAEKELDKAGIKAWRNTNALTVVFPRPHLKICHKWQLASEGSISHLICMPGITKEHIDEFTSDMKNAPEHQVNCEVGSPDYNLN